jgi:hypothetical protein
VKGFSVGNIEEGGGDPALSGCVLLLPTRLQGILITEIGGVVCRGEVLDSQVATGVDGLKAEAAV